MNLYRRKYLRLAKKIEIHIENNGYIVTNGTEEVRMDRLTLYQESGIKKIMDLIKG